MTWYPHLCEDGMWQPRHKDGRTVPLWFDRPGECIAYLHRSGLLPQGLTVITPNAAKFLDQWNKCDQRNRAVILPDNGMKITPVETGPAGPSDQYGRPPVPGECRHKQFPPSRCSVCTAPDDPDYASTQPPDDDRWEWVQIGTWDNPNQWIKGACRHKTPVPVDAYPTGELVAWLCPDCGGTFDPDRWPVPEGMWRRIPVLFEGGPSGSLHKINGQPVLRQDDGPCPHHRCGERGYTCACQTCTECNGKEHTPWWVWTGAGIFVSLYYDLAIDVVWNRIKNAAPWVWCTWPVIAVMVWYVGIILGWWSE